MKTCKNCSSPNEVTAVKCHSCNMENHFTLHVSPVELPPIPESTTLQCVNCGSHESSEVPQCTQCRFPLALVTVKPISKLAQLNRKVG